MTRLRNLKLTREEPVSSLSPRLFSNHRTGGLVSFRAIKACLRERYIVGSVLAEKDMWQRDVWKRDIRERDIRDRDMGETGAAT
jgi:hypothetical protein